MSVQVLVRLQTVSLDFIFPSVYSPYAEFREPRVIELWEAAKRANLSEDELDSLKVALPSLLPVFFFGLFFFHQFVSW